MFLHRPSISVLIKEQPLCMEQAIHACYIFLSFFLSFKAAASRLTINGDDIADFPSYSVCPLPSSRLAYLPVLYM